MLIVENVEYLKKWRDKKSHKTHMWSSHLSLLFIFCFFLTEGMWPTNPVQ